MFERAGYNTGEPKIVGDDKYASCVMQFSVATTPATANTTKQTPVVTTPAPLAVGLANTIS